MPAVCAAGWIALGLSAGCKREQHAAPPRASGPPRVQAPASATPRRMLPAAPGSILLQRTSTRLPRPADQEAARRLPHFTVFDSGLTVWTDAEQPWWIDIGPNTAAAWHAELVALGLGEIESYERPQRPTRGALCVQVDGTRGPCKPGGVLRTSDSSVAVWRVRTAAGALVERRHYAGWAPGRDDDLRAIEAKRDGWIGLLSRRAGRHRLLTARGLVVLDRNDGGHECPRWPLSLGWLAVLGDGRRVVSTVTADELHVLLDAGGLRRRCFSSGGTVAWARVVPLLPAQAT